MRLPYECICACVRARASQTCAAFRKHGKIHFSALGARGGIIRGGSQRGWCWCWCWCRTHRLPVQTYGKWCLYLYVCEGSRQHGKNESSCLNLSLHCSGQENWEPSSLPDESILAKGFIEHFSRHLKHFTLNPLFIHSTVTLVGGGRR